MCLYVDDYDATLLDSGERRARKQHRCDECGRVIEPGERYSFWAAVVPGDGFQVSKMCAHCWGTIELGAALTGCHKNWFWGEVHNHRDEEMGFVGNILLDTGHDLSIAQGIKMLRTVAGRRRGWRRSDGSLLPVPALSGKSPRGME